MLRDIWNIQQLQFKDGHQGHPVKWHPNDEQETSSNLFLGTTAPLSSQREPHKHDLKFWSIIQHYTFIFISKTPPIWQINTVNILVSNISFQLFLFVESAFISVQLLTLYLLSRKCTKKKMDVYLILSLTALKEKTAHFSYCSSLPILFINLGLSS